MKIYLDNAATTKPSEEVVEVVVDIMRNHYGNPSSIHRMGFDIEKIVESSRSMVAQFLKVNTSEIYFTSGGTEANNLAIDGILENKKNRSIHVITSMIEHPSVLKVFKEYSSRENIEVDYIGVTQEGIVDIDEIKSKIKENTVLVSIMAVNNEVGSIQSVESIADMIKKENKNIVFHVDGVQSFGKITINLKNIDLYSFSGHKIHGPKGVGGLYIKRETAIKSILLGGEQEQSIRPGTENTTGIVGMGEAVKNIQPVMSDDYEYINKLKKHTIKKLKDSIDDIKFNSEANENFSPYILNISISDIRGEILVHSLEEDEIYLSTTSACSSKLSGRSHVLEAMKLSDNKIDGSIRISFSKEITKDDIDYVVGKMEEAVSEIRSIMRR